MRCRAHFRMRSSRSGLQVETRSLPGSGSLWHFTGYLPWGARRRGMRANPLKIPSLYASRRIGSLRCPLGRDGSLPSSTRRSCRSQGSGHLFLRSHSPISTLSFSNLRRGCCFNSLRYWSLASACPSPRSSWRIVWSVHTPQPHHPQPTIRNLTPVT